jgi:lysophospholipase L1-like esterase
MTRRLRILLLLPLSLLALAVLLELVLQVGARVVKDQARHVEARWLTGHTRILALGDSNTYGFYLEAKDAWPAQLQQQWNSAYPDRSIEVLNLGYPGTNSFRVRDNLPALLDKLAPDIVFIMVGFNDFWTPLETVANTVPSVFDSIKHYGKTHSRLYRAYVMWQRSRIRQQDMTFGSPRPSETTDLAVMSDPANIEKHLLKMDGDTFYLGTKQGEPARDRRALADNLTAMINLVRARDAEVVLMTYPSHWGFYPGANQWLKKSAQQHATGLLDITPFFITHCTEGPSSCPELLFYDGHATAEGNAQVADRAFTFLVQKILITP